MGDFFMDKEFFGGNKRKYIIILLVVISVYFFMKYISPVVSPFLLAFLAAGFLSRLKNKLSIQMKTSFLAGLILLIAAVLLGVVLWGVGSFLFHKTGEMLGQTQIYEEEFCRLLGDCCDRMEDSFGVDGAEIENFVLEQVNLFVENLEVKVMPAVMDKSLGYFKNAAGLIGFLGVTLIALFLFLKDYEKIRQWFIQNEDLKGILEVGEKVIDYIRTFLRAQFIILCVISTICAATLGIMGIRGGVWYGIVTGFMDVLPFIGTGLMLIPLAVFQLLYGNYGRAVLIVCLYGICALLREFLEPKLIGNKVGIWPVGILFAVFAGIRLFGIFGIIKGPVGLVIICEVCKYLLNEKSKTEVL